MKNEARLATKLYVAIVWCNARQIEIELSKRPFPLSSVGNRLRTRAELRFFEKEEPARSSRFDEPLRCKQENNVPLLQGTYNTVLIFFADRSKASDIIKKAH